MKPYDYLQRKGVDEISWEFFGQLAASLAEQLSHKNPEIIIGIARAGLFPATAVACALRRELFPVRITRRKNDIVVAKHPIWKIDVPVDVEGKIVAVIDEIADSGETLTMVSQRVQGKGARLIVTASLVSHSWASPLPDCIALLTDALVIFPWDKQVFQDGKWQPHPELAEALALQHKQ